MFNDIILITMVEKSFILKTHMPDANVLSLIKDGVMPCICTVRRPEDAIASWMNTFGFSLEDGINSLKSWYSWYVTVADKVLTIDYQVIESKPKISYGINN